MAKFWCKETRMFCRLEVGIIEPVFALLLFRPTIHKSSCEMLPLTALCAYSQYEAVEARLGDPDGSLEVVAAKPLLQELIKNPACHHFCSTAIRGGMKPAICLFVSCRAQTPSDGGDSNYSPFNSQTCLCIFRCA